MIVLTPKQVKSPIFPGHFELSKAIRRQRMLGKASQYADRRTKRNRTRSQQRQAALSDS